MPQDFYWFFFGIVIQNVFFSFPRMSGQNCLEVFILWNTINQKKRAQDDKDNEFEFLEHSYMTLLAEKIYPYKLWSVNVTTKDAITTSYVTDYRILRLGIKRWKDFCKKIKAFQWNVIIFRTWSTLLWLYFLWAKANLIFHPRA